MGLWISERDAWIKLHSLCARCGDKYIQVWTFEPARTQPICHSAAGVLSQGHSDTSLSITASAVWRNDLFCRLTFDLWRQTYLTLFLWRKYLFFLHHKHVNAVCENKFEQIRTTLCTFCFIFKTIFPASSGIWTCHNTAFLTSGLRCWVELTG